MDKVSSFFYLFLIIKKSSWSWDLRFLSRCVKWVQEAFPPGGECSGLLVIYEQCVRSSGTRTGTRMIFVTSKSGWKCNVFFSSSLKYLLLYWKCSLLKGSGLSFWRRSIALMRKWFISFWRLMILGGRMVFTTEIMGCTWSIRVRWRLLMRSSISESLGEFSSFWVLGFCHVIWLIKCETLCRNAKPVEKLNDAYKKFMLRTMRRTTTVDDIRSFFCMFIYA